MLKAFFERVVFQAPGTLRIEEVDFFFHGKADIGVLLEEMGKRAGAAFCCADTDEIDCKVLVHVFVFLSAGFKAFQSYFASISATPNRNI